MREHISYSEIRIWSECPYKHKLKYIDKVDGFKGNEFTLFGTVVHNTCEKALLTGSMDPSTYFMISFLKEAEKLKEKGVVLDATLLTEMEKQGKHLSKKVMPALQEHFKEYEVFSTEEMLYENVEEGLPKFKGYIDLVLKIGDIYHILDWKTCSWGWNARKKNNKLITYQLTLYKYFFAKKHNIDIKNIETHFALLKRTAKKNEVEIFRVSSGLKKVNNALNLLKNATYNISVKRYIKNRTSCDMCEFYQTAHCK
jgi:hypothetical protein